MKETNLKGLPYPNFWDFVNEFNNVGYEGAVEFKNGKKPIEFIKKILELSNVKYWKSKENKFKLFYPDWIIRFKDGRIGIFDTKGGNTALPENVKEKAKALSIKIRSLGKKYVGGIVIFENGVWYYNDSEEYDYVEGKLDKNWERIEKLF